MKKKLFVFVLLFILLILVGCNSYKNITITYFINDISIVKNYDDKIIITEDVICTITDYEIEGVYLDCEYNLLYEDEVISENIDIFIKIKEDKKEEETQYEGLSHELYEKVILDYIDLIRFKESNEIFLYEDIKIDKYLGVFNDSVIASFYSIYQKYDHNYYYIDMVWKEVIEDIELYYDSLNMYLVWNDSSFYTISEAYELNILTYDDIIEISKVLYNAIDTSKIDKEIEFNSLINNDEIDYITYSPNQTNKLCSFYDSPRETINLILNKYFREKNLSFNIKYNKKINQDDIFSKMSFNMRNHWVTDIYVYFMEGKIYIYFGKTYNFILESTQENMIDLKEMDNFIISRCPE